MLEKQNTKLSKSLNESKNKMRMEKKMARVYEFMMTKGQGQGNQNKENELQLVELMKNSLSGSGTGNDSMDESKIDKVLDDRIQKLNNMNNIQMKHSEDYQGDIKNMKLIVDEMKASSRSEKESHTKVIESMAKNFEKMQKNMMDDYNTKLVNVQETLSNQFTANLKNQIMDESIKKMTTNFEQVSKLAIDVTKDDVSDTKIANLEDKIALLSNKISEEKEEKQELRNDLVAFKNKVDHMNKKETTSNAVNDQMNKLIKK